MKITLNFWRTKEEISCLGHINSYDKPILCLYEDTCLNILQEGIRKTRDLLLKKNYKANRSWKISWDKRVLQFSEDSYIKLLIGHSILRP